MAYGNERRVSIGGATVPAGLVWSGVLVIVLGALGFWVLSNNLGSGDAEAADVRTRFRSFVEAVADGDGATACAMVPAANAAAFAERAAVNLGVEAGTCPEMIAAFAAGRTPADSTLLRGVEILDIRMVGADAAIELPPDGAEVDIPEGTVVLARRAGCAGSSDCWIVTDGAPVYRMADPTRGG